LPCYLPSLIFGTENDSDNFLVHEVYRSLDNQCGNLLVNEHFHNVTTLDKSITIIADSGLINAVFGGENTHTVLDYTIGNRHDRFDQFARLRKGVVIDNVFNERESILALSQAVTVRMSSGTFIKIEPEDNQWSPFSRT
jgi:hypothetical protein